MHVFGYYVEAQAILTLNHRLETGYRGNASLLEATMRATGKARVVLQQKRKKFSPMANGSCD